MLESAPASPAARGATRAPKGAQNVADGLMKARRSRKIVLTAVDRRTAIARRIAEIRAIYIAALGGDDISPLKLLKIDEASQLKCVAELARGDFLRGGETSLHDVIRAERRADASVRNRVGPLDGAAAIHR